MVKRALLAVLASLATVSFLSAATVTTGAKVSIPAGTVIHCRIAETLTTKLNTAGQAFQATVSEPVMIDGREAIPVGSTIQGRIANLQRPGRIKGVGEMRLLPETLALPGGRTFSLTAVLLTTYGAEGAKVDGAEGTIKGPTSRIESIEEIGGGTGVGTLLGLIFHHPIVGAAVGGTAGLVDRMRRRGKDLNLPAGTQLNYQLMRALELEGHSTPTGIHVSEQSLGAGH
ncbi:MAG: hypothetical protein LAP13_00190 [Acidobacteriia bacterium]|nr:hypothetical protein [Terriglobia bacterium]